MVFVDTNILLRWLLGDHKTLSPQAEELVEAAEPATLLITDVIMAEIVYVLRGTGRDRQQTGEALLLLERTPAFKYENEELALEIITLLTETKLDFADCHLLARARREKRTLHTFDNELRKLYISVQ